MSDIEEILKGIDQCETDSPDGWWETSAGAEFGARKLAEIREVMAARAQGGEAVKWCKDRGHQAWFLRTGEQCTCAEKFEYHTRLYTHPAPSVPK